MDGIDRPRPNEAGGEGGPLDRSELRLDQPLLTVDELAALLAVKPGWVYSAARDGQLPAVRVGKHLRFIRDDIERWILERRTT